MTALMRDPKIVFGRFRVLPRTDGKFIVYDPKQPFAARSAFVGTLAEAGKECERLSAEATARGEPNEVERTGFRLDWGDPATWDAMADVPPRPLFPSLHEHEKKADPDHGEEQASDSAGERLELELELGGSPKGRRRRAPGTGKAHPRDRAPADRAHSKAAR